MTNACPNTAKAQNCAPSARNVLGSASNTESEISTACLIPAEGAHLRTLSTRYSPPEGTT